MKYSVTIQISIVLLLLLLLPTLPSARHVASKHTRHAHHEMARLVKGEKVVMKNRGFRKPLGVAGSSLPDCSHACGSCSPCKLVMVSFVCASIEEAESCPVAYRCMCKNKAYPVP